jgi:outer membrane protein W
LLKQIKGWVTEMKSASVFFFFMSLFSISAYSQSDLKSGTFSINGTISYTSNYEESSDMDNSTFIFNPRFDYFIINNFSLGLMLNYQNNSFFGHNNSSWGIGPSARYYFTFDKIKPFVGAGYSYASENSTLTSDDIINNNIILTLGVDYFLTENVALETTVNYTFMNMKFPDVYSAYYNDLNVSRKSLSVGIGVNVFLR